MSERTIWDRLRESGFSEEATAAIMGNMQAESGLVPYRIQGDFSDGYTRSQNYTNQVDGNYISKDDFVYHGPGGGGYGLCQWTFSSRKEGLYDLAKKRFVSIGNEAVQIDYFIEELKKAEYSRVLDTLMNSHSIYDMVTVFVRVFERPADQSDAVCNYRTSLARTIYNTYSGSTPEPEPEPQPEPVDPTGDSCEVVAPILKKGSKGTAVVMAQRALLCFECDLGTTGPYQNGVDGVFGESTENAVFKFQRECNLAETGVVDADTWQVLLQ